MAGPAPAPKDQRRRRNKPARGEWVDLAPLKEPAIPSLAELEPEVIWGEGTVRAWEAWRKDPVTALWTEADLAYAVDTILLHNADPVKNAAEIRLRMTTLGLNPKGKRDLRWRVPGDPQREAEEAEAAECRPSRVRSRSADRRARLSVVK